MNTRARPGRALLLGVTLVGALGAAGTAGPRVGRTPSNPLAAQPRRLDLGEIGALLDQTGYQGWHADERGGFVVLRVQGENGIFSVYLVPSRGILHLQMPRLLTLPPGDLRVSRLLATLNDLNWRNTLGRYSRDAGDGEVRYSAALVAPGGLALDAFSAALTLALRTVDRDLPDLRRAAGTSARGVESAPPRRP